MKKDHKDRNIFEWFLVITVIITLFTGGYESYAQRYRPDISVLNYLHRYHLLKTYPIIYDPGKVKVRETTKESLLALWMQVINKTKLEIRTKEKMLEVKREDELFRVFTSKSEYQTKNIILAIGRRGTPRKLGVPGEKLPKVSYRLLEPEQHKAQNLLVVGGGDSAIEAAIALARQRENRVVLSYRGEAFSRIKPMNKERLDDMVSKKCVTIMFKSNVKEIGEKSVKISTPEDIVDIPNDYVYIFAGGELPNEFLNKIGVQIEKRFGT